MIIEFYPKLGAEPKKVLNYIVKGGGKISAPRAAHDLHISADELRASIERLKQRRELEEK